MGYLKALQQKLLADIITVPQIVSGSYFPALDGLRAVAVLMVILYHFSLNHYLRPFHILINGDTGVNIFFVISGFLITTLLCKEKLQHGQISLKRFYAKRALRIIPAAWFFLMGLIILNAVYHFHLSGSQFSASFLFYKNLPYQAEPYSGHFWSLAAEVQFYLFFMFLLALDINRYMVFIGVIIILVPVVSVLGYNHVGFMASNPVINVITKIAMYSFWNGPYIVLIGSLFAILLFKNVINLDNIKVNPFLSTVLLITAIAISGKTFMGYAPYLSEFITAVLTGWVILLSLKAGFLTQLLSNNLLVKTGVISYSLYIWQQPFLGIRTWQPWMQAFSSFPLWALILVRLVIVFAIATASYYFVERPFLKLKDKFK